MNADIPNVVIKVIIPNNQQESSAHEDKQYVTLLIALRLAVYD